MDGLSDNFEKIHHAYENKNSIDKFLRLYPVGISRRAAAKPEQTTDSFSTGLINPRWLRHYKSIIDTEKEPVRVKDIHNTLIVGV